MKIIISKNIKQDLHEKIITANKSSQQNPCWNGYQMIGMKSKNGKKVPNCVKIKKANNGQFNQMHQENEQDNLKMFKANLENIQQMVNTLKQINNEQQIKGWVADKVSTSKQNLSSIVDYLSYYQDYIQIDGQEDQDGIWDGEECHEEQLNENNNHSDEIQHVVIASSKKKGKNVKLNKPFRTPGGPKKFSVYVKNQKGNTVKVNFGDPNMEIKRDSSERRKSFRARHNCENPGPKWKARYWSCKMWSSKNVSDIT